MSTLKDQTELGGVFGESVSARKVNGRLIFKNRPKRKAAKAVGLAATNQEKFQEATIYASNLTDESKEIYSSGVKGKMRSAFVVAVSDYLNAPRVGPIYTSKYKGAVEDAIVVKAKDDFMVTSVTVIITDAAGNELEQGEAVQNLQKIFMWTYEATVANPSLPGTKITAIAFDRAGNSTEFEKVL
ncbi:MAG: hypothetical protein HOP08_15995 [Cyclobacteriaceae bacterium]|nr:hypothetical protein [Cyclobacteriaceae bacterium]